MNKFMELIQAQIDRDRAYSAEHGYSFTERDASRHTIGDFIRAVLAIDDATDARAFYDGCVAFHAAQAEQHERGPEYVTKANIGWCYGEGMAPERIAMWREVTGASHPVFGDAMPSSSEAALAAGVAAGKALRS